MNLGRTASTQLYGMHLLICGKALMPSKQVRFVHSNNAVQLELV